MSKAPEKEDIPNTGGVKLTAPLHLALVITSQENTHLLLPPPVGATVNSRGRWG